MTAEQRRASAARAAWEAYTAAGRVASEAQAALIAVCSHPEVWEENQHHNQRRACRACGVEEYAPYVFLKSGPGKWIRRWSGSIVIDYGMRLRRAANGVLDPGGEW